MILLNNIPSVDHHLIIIINHHHKKIIIINPSIDLDLLTQEKEFITNNPYLVWLVLKFTYTTCCVYNLNQYK